MIREDTLLAAVRAHRASLAAHEGASSESWRPPISLSDLAASEQALGFALPSILKRIYLEVSNGVVTPAKNVIAGARGGLPLEDDEAIDRYLMWRTPPEDYEHWRWPEGLLPLSHWGCAAYSCVDCTRPEGPVFSFEAAAYEPGVELQEILAADKPDLVSWIASLYGKGEL